jgi:hypothetical protein
VVSIENTAPGSAEESEHKVKPKQKNKRRKWKTSSRQFIPFYFGCVSIWVVV